MNKLSDKTNKFSKVCPKCQFGYQDKDGTECKICHASLISIDEAKILQRTHSSRSKRVSGKNQLGKLIKQLPTLKVSAPQNLKLGLMLREAQKPINLFGLFFVGFMLMLWANYLFIILPQKRVVTNKVDNLKIEKLTAPKGLFNYGGSPIFAPIVASGINGLIEVEYPGFELRYTKPSNQDYSSSNGIRMLIEGELSFAYNERTLTDAEYRKAQLRGFKLKQVPIAIDGVVFYGNLSTTGIQHLNQEQVRQIFAGEIDNWQQIDRKAEDLPIVPVVIENEYVNPLGIDGKNQISESTQYTANYTQALRKVISTPGSISFASSSIVKNQTLIKIYDLAEGNSENYVYPNIDDFKSGEYPLTRRVFIVLREDGTIDELAGKAYLEYLTSEVGQKQVSKSGLVQVY